MKKVLLGLVIVVVVIAGGAVFLFSNLDKLVKTGIETAGTSTLGTRVSVGDVALDLVAGTASIYNFVVANPAGYTNGDMLCFSELSVGINLQDTSGERVHINSVVARSPYVFYESIDGTSNMDTISARFDTQETEESESQVMLVIDSIVIEDIQGTLQSDKLPSALNVDLGDIRLSDLEGYPEDLAGQIMGPLLGQIAASSAQAIVKATTELLNDAAGKVGDQLGESLDDVGDKANEALDKVGNLFKRN